MCEENNLAFGVVFKSATSGLWYQNREAAGDIVSVRVDCVTFEKINTSKKGASYCDKHGAAVLEEVHTELKSQNEGLKHNLEQALVYLKRVKEEECSNEAWNLIDTAAEFLEI